jgi:guanine nucleotide-binding protein G(I)/G(S)/G(T) subunit beta-1
MTVSIGVVCCLVLTFCTSLSRFVHQNTPTTPKQVASLIKKIEEIQKSKKDKSMGQTVKASSTVMAPVRSSNIKARRVLKGHFGRVTAMHWAGDSQNVVSASQDGNLLIWNAFTANKIQSIPLKSSYVMAVGFEQKKSQLVACGGLDNLCTIYRRSAPDKPIEMASHDGFVSCCRFLSETEIITSSGDSRCIHWDISRQQPINFFAEHKADAIFLSIKPGDANVFVSCSVDSTAKVWDIRSPQQSVQTFRGHLGDISEVEFMPSDGNCFATCGQDESVRLFDLRAYNELKFMGTAGVDPTTAVTPSDGYTSLAFSKSGRIIFCGHADGHIKAFDVLSDRASAAFSINNAHERQVSSLGMSPNGDALCTASWDSVLKVYA